jgi:hypothetical protein
MTGLSSVDMSWPELPYLAWKDTYATLHLWTQVVGKIRLALTPWLNHSWHVALYVTPRGLTTSPIPYGMRSFDMEFDFINHRLAIRTDDGEQREVALYPRTVASFYAELMRALAGLGIEVEIDEMPNEIADAVPLSQDHAHESYDPDYAERHWRSLLQADRVLKLFRTAFIGKASPVHFFWGSFDLAATRFSGRRAPLHPGGVPNLSDEVTCEAYSHEVSSAGFWPGNELVPYPAFYSYAYPEPAGFAEAKVEPDAAFYHQQLKEFILPYEAVRTAADPDAALLSFLQTSYAAAADLGGWDRAALECGLGVPNKPRPI